MKMKKIKFEGKLSLNKETIAKLNDDGMNSIKGGEDINRKSIIICPSVIVQCQTKSCMVSICISIPQTK